MSVMRMCTCMRKVTSEVECMRLDFSCFLTACKHTLHNTKDSERYTFKHTYTLNIHYLHYCYCYDYDDYCFSSYY